MTRNAPEPQDAEPPACQTCGDVAVSMRVLSVDRAAALAVCVDQADTRRTVDTGLLAAVDPGDSVLVHAGTALARGSR